MRTRLDLAELLDISELPKYLEAVDMQLIESVKTDNTQIFNPIARLINAGGKRLRPALIIACSSFNSGTINKDVIKLASAVELLHLGSLVHDDIIDEADTRWNVNTINHVEGSNQAIVIGDYLLASACAQAATVSQSSAKLMADTIIELCSGQNLELNDVQNLNRTQSSMMQAIEGKTAALISAACVFGGMCAGLDSRQLKSLKEFGHNFGVAFQLIDDLMDLLSTEQLYGKPVGNDIVEGVYTLPILIGLEGSHAKTVKKLITTKKISPTLIEILFDSGAIEETLDKIRQYNHGAAKAMKQFNNPIAQAMQKLPDSYLNWVLSNLIANQYRSQMQKV